MSELLHFFWRHYRARTIAIVALQWLAALLDFLSLSSLLPLLQILTRTEASGPASPLVLGLLGGLTPTVPALLALITVLLLIKALLRWLAMRQVASAVVTVAHELRAELHTAALAANWRFFVQTPAGHLAAAVTSEAFRAAFAYRRACAVLAATLQLAFTVILVVLISAWAGLAALAAGVAVTSLLGFIVRASRAAGNALTEATRALSARIIDTAHALKPARAMGRDTGMARWLEEANSALAAAETQQLRTSEALQAAHEPLIALAVALTLSGAYAITGQSAAELLVLGLLFYRVLQQVNVIQLEYQGLVWGEAAWRALRAQIESARRLGERTGVTDAMGESGTTGLPGTKGARVFSRELRVVDLSFGYQQECVLEQVNLTIPFGALVLVTGPSGVGKTTLLDLIAGLHTPSAGRILVDGVPMAQLDLHAWRRQIGYVAQEPALLHASVMDNLTLGASVPYGQVHEALECAHAAEFVAALPEGLETIVGEQGFRLSGGQRQRLALARALVHRPRLLLLDEPTANVDPVTQAAIGAALAELRGDRAILLVSHHADYLQISDSVVTLTPNMTRAFAGSS
jgi:ATP-binding cassette, subfamily C, bacterial